MNSEIESSLDFVTIVMLAIALFVVIVLDIHKLLFFLLIDLLG